MSVLTPVARWTPITSPINNAAGMWVRGPKGGVRINAFTYAYQDLAQTLNQQNTVVGYYGRIAFIQGGFGDDVLNFGIGYSLASYVVLGDFYTNDLGPTSLVFPDAQDGMFGEDSQGITCLVSRVVIGGGSGSPQMVSKVFVSTTPPPAQQYGPPLVQQAGTTPATITPTQTPGIVSGSESSPAELSGYTSPSGYGSAPGIRTPEEPGTSTTAAPPGYTPPVPGGPDTTVPGFKRPSPRPTLP